jgi:hypothetical protein
MAGILTETFRAESELARRTERPISLADIKSRQTPVEWFEGIAVIQEVCRTLHESGAAAEASFEAEDVLIDAAGQVSANLHEGSEDDSVVRQVGELLHLVLADSSFPVPLRLVITQATATPPSYASIAELSSALEYFERPDRRGLIRALYERALKLPAGAERSEAAGPPEQKRPAPKKKHSATKDRPPHRPLPRGLIFGAAFAIAAIVIGTGAVAWSSGRPQRVIPLADVEAGSSKATDRRKPASNAGSVSPATLPKAPRELPANGSGNAKVLLPRGSQALRDVAPQTTTERSATAESPARGASGADVPVTFAAYDVPAGSTSEGPIYSASDGDVTPPVATYPRLPAEPPTGVRAEALATLELLVTESGEVESVRLRGRPSHLAEALMATMNLSAAKTWRFVPALRDGRPVKYRKLVHVWLSTP